MRTWFIIDTRTNDIVNACEGARSEADALRGFEHPEYLRATQTPSRAQLEGYRYWNERP